MTTTAGQRQRIAPSPTQLALVQQLLDQVPALAYDWQSREGRGFLTEVASLMDAGVPVAWIAEPLGLEPQRLYHTLARHRRAAGNTREGTTA